MNEPVILVTGAARRVGAVIVRTLHAAGYRIAVHFRHSSHDALALCDALNTARPGTSASFSADLTDAKAPESLVAAVLKEFGRLDGIVNNASAFFPTPIGSITIEQWETLMTANARAPFFLAQAAAGELRTRGGAIVNVVDIYGERPLPRYPAYSVSKAALRMSTLALAEALAPEVRVNAVAPGTVLWSENPQKAESLQQVENGTVLRRVGTPEDVATAVLYLLRDARYTTGSVLPIEGGRLLNT